MNPRLHLNALSILSVVLFLFAFFASSTIASASPATVQDNSGYVADAASVAVAFSSNVTSGHAIIVAQSTYDAQTISTPTDTQGNSFTQVVTAGTSGAAVAAIYVATAKSSAADTVTCAINSANNIHCHIYEASGISTTVDKTGTNSQAGTALTVSTSASTANANDYVFAYFADNHSAATYTVGSGYGNTQASEDTSGGDSGFSEVKVVTATGTQTATATGSTTDTFVNLIVTLEATAASTPTFSPAAGTYSSAQTVTISDSTSGSTIYYTTNGTTPTTASSTYSSAITVSATETLEAIATASGDSPSAVGSAAYTISSASIHTVQDNSGYVADASSVAVSFGSNVTSGDVVLVAVSTYDAQTISTPTDTQGNSFTQVVTAGTSGAAVAAIYVATAKSTAADTVTCAINSANNIHCHVYEVSGASTTVDKTGTNSQAGTALTVSTSASTSNANDYVFAYFADNHSAATYTVGSGYGDTQSSIDTSGGDSGFSEDKVVSATGTQTATATGSTTDTFVNLIVTLEASGSEPVVATPTFSPAAGAYGPAQTVTISDTTSGANIYYTTNGTTPTTASTHYTAAVTVSVTQTLEAIATHSGDVSSSVGSAAYTINGAVATPGFSPAAGTYSSAQTVTITDSTSGATIYYTTNGTTPTTASTTYSSAITVSSTETVKALATHSGYSNSAVGSAAYTISLPVVATPTFSPAGGDYSSSQTVTISDTTSGATIYYTTNGSTPTTASSVYSSAISVTATETLEALATHSGDTNSAIASAVYTISSGSGTCDGMSVGTSVAGTADMNGFVPFQSATTGLVSQWNTNIANAAVDPNNAAIQTTAGYSGLSTHVNFGSSTSDGGIPFMIVDSSETPTKVPIYVYDYATTSDNVVAPYSTTVPIEGAAADCSGWPDTYQSDAHTNVLDRYTCWDYETYNTNRCNGLYDASEETIWDMTNGEYRPWGWTSTDAAGLSVMAGLTKYDEAASGTIKHAIRMTMQQTKNDANGGYFVEPASHAAGTTYGAPTPEGMRVRLNSTFNISGYSAINQAILTAFQQYGMIVADNGGYFYIQGATDSRWDDSDLANLGGIPSSDFTVVQMTPTYPGYDSVTAPTGSAPTISSFTASTTSITSGSPVTFDFTVSGDSYNYIDMIGPVRVTSGSGTVTINPTVTQTYTLYSVNQYGNNGYGAGNGVTVSTPTTVVVSGSTLSAPVFSPVAGTYTTSPLVITLNNTTYPYATIYYTTNGSTPTTASTMYPQIPQPMGSQSLGNVEDLIVSATETIKAIAVAPGYSSPSAVSSATYTIN
jgi:hypothetical protein